MKSQQVRLALTGLALGVLLALLIAPQTRWLGRLQILTVLRLYHPLPSGPCYTGSSAGDRDRYQAVAARHPDDFAIQYAAAVTDDGHDKTLAGLHALTTRFPDRPALYANLLRYEMLGKIHLQRPEDNLLAGLPPSHKFDTGYHNAPTDLASFDADAAAGERLDPDNAYFPLMRAVGLFAAFRDAEGLAAFRRASTEPSWREYCADEVEARWRLHEEAFGDPGALGRVAAAAGLLLPQYQQLRALARLILVKAVQQEQAGHRKEGLELREALRRCGDLIRVQSTYGIGALVAVAICEIATDRTGGMTPPKATPGLSPDQWGRRRLDAYCAYATRLGHPEFAARARAEEAAGQQVSALIEINNPMAEDQRIQPFLRLTRWWQVGVVVLSNILWLLLFGGLAAGLGRTRWVQSVGGNKKPVLSRRAALRRGIITAGILAAGFLLADSLLHFFQPPNLLGGIIRSIETLFLLLAVFALPPTLAVYLLRRGFRLPLFSWPGLLRSVGVALLAGSVLYGLCALLGWQAGGLEDIEDGLHSLLGVTGAGDERDDAQQASARWLSAAVVFTVPLLLLLISGVAARIRRVPVSVGLVRGFAAAALPIASLLLLLWGGLLLGTVRQEGIVNARVRHQVHDEGPYLAAQAGQSWPGPVR